MLLIHQIVPQYLPAKRRKGSHGWEIFDSVCCHHRGHNRDTKSRGNFNLSSDGSITVHCYNCGFKSAFKNNEISKSFENWMRWLGIPTEKIQEIKFEIFTKMTTGELSPSKIEILSNILEPLREIELPTGAKSINQLLDENFESKDFFECITYLGTRGRAIATNFEYFWTPDTYKFLNKRLIIPFKDKNKIVGWTARYCGDVPKGVTRYHNSDKSNNVLFNSDVISLRFRKYILISEGPFDAIALDGVGTLGSKLNQGQISWLNSSDKEKIVVPDRQLKNQELIDTAIQQGWSVSFPDWGTNIKDAADASKHYGRLYTISSAINAKTINQTEIEVKRRFF